MRIDKIVLNNFGSYEGETAFLTNSESGRNIVLIGGKNGAGKTTLFTAMRICLYGYMSMGYKNHNAYYTRAITKLLNNTAKMSKPTNAFVMMVISLSNGRDLDQYELTRSWVLSDSLTERFTVLKNGFALTAEEIADFEKYILSLIPPELFNLYFFDGEKIADFFLNEGSNIRIKEAFLTLCGYDTFEIMRRNFKRVSAGNPESSKSLEEYWNAKQDLDSESLRLVALESELRNCVHAVEICEADIEALDKAYTQKGGISQEEWNQKVFQLREEEKKRDSWNALLRKWANEIIPFAMIRRSIIEVKNQISRENENQKYRSFCEIIDLPEIKVLIGENADRIKSFAHTQYAGDSEPILGLSFEQSATILAQINAVLAFDQSRITKYKRAIKKSINLSAKIRDELNNSSVASVQEYMKQRAELLECKAMLLERRVELEQEISLQKEVVLRAETTLKKIHGKLESELKKASINDISTKAIVMLDKLEQILFKQQVAKVEAFFRREIRTLMRKTNFIDDIEIDESFNITIYRTDSISVHLLRNLVSEHSEIGLMGILGHKAIQKLYELCNGCSLSDVMDFLESAPVDSIELPIPVDQTSLSNGEKQIYIMALYHALVQLGHHDIPFIIDTPFARIDTEHRRNISQHFFCELQGQVFILSTNEEIDSEHVQIMKDRIAATYMLENSDSKKTVVVQNSYFEV